MADTINLSAQCGGTIGVPSNGSVGCSDSGAVAGASASVFPFNVQTFTSGALASASASSSALLEIDFSGGTGSGTYIPCMTTNFGGSAGASVSFGTSDWSAKVPAGGSCSPISGATSIPFVFDVPQIQEITLLAGSTGTGSASASWAGFDVFDSGGNLLTSATWTVTDVPEPAAGILLVAGLTALFLSKR
jgi:hypothetical protein